MKRHPTEWGNFSKHIFDKGLSSRIHKEPLQFYNTKTNNPVKKTVQKTSIDTSLRKITKWLKDIQHH